MTILLIKKAIHDRIIAIVVATIMNSELKSSERLPLPSNDGPEVLADAKYNRRTNISAQETLLYASSAAEGAALNNTHLDSTLLLSQTPLPAQSNVPIVPPSALGAQAAAAVRGMDPD